MGKITGFMEFQRLREASEAPAARKQHYHEFIRHLSDQEAAVQGARCMDCGTPFCMRVCPAPCEAACTLNISNDPVGIKSIEHAIIDKGWEMGWVRPAPPESKTGKKVAIVGSGPAGLACAQQLARAGHEVALYEKNDRIGGLLRYGIPDFKLEKHLIDRRMEQMQAEGVRFRPNSFIGKDISAQKILADYDAVVLT